MNIYIPEHARPGMTWRCSETEIQDWGAPAMVASLPFITPWHNPVDAAFSPAGMP